MPKIPDSSAIRMPPAAVPGMIPEMVGQRAVQKTIDQAFALGEQYKRQRQQSEMVKLSGDMERSLLDLQIEIEQNPEIKTAEQASQLYGARAKAIVEDYTGRGKWKSVQTAVGARGLRTSMSGLASVSRVGYAREIEASRATLIENSKTYSNRYALAENLSARADAISRFEVDLEMSPLGDDEKAKRRLAFDADRVFERTTYLTNEGRFGEAREYLKDPEATSVLDPTGVARLSNRIDIEEHRRQREIDKARAEALDDQYRQAWGDVRAAETPEEFLAAQNEVDRLREGGLSVERAISLDSAIFTRGAQMRKDLAAASRIEFAIDHDQDLGPEDQEDLDTYYEKFLLPERAATMSEEEVFEATVTLVADKKLVPSALTEQIEKMARSDNVQHVFTAADRYHRLRQAAPRVDLGFSGKDQAFLENMKIGADLNEEPEKLLEREKKIYGMTEAELDTAKKSYRKLEKDDTNADWLKKQTSISDVERAWGLNPSVDEIPNALLARFSVDTERWFLIDPDSGINRARERALEGPSVVWGATDIGPQTRTVPFPPEKMDERWDGDSGAIEEMLIRDVKRARMDLRDEDLLGNLILNAGPDAARQIPNLGYLVTRLDDEGNVVEDVMVMSDGVTPMLFYPDWGASLDATMEGLKNKRAGEDAKALDAYLKGDGSLQDIHSSTLRARAMAWKGIAAVVTPDPAEMERLAREDQEFFEGIDAVANRLKARHAGFPREVAEPEETLELRRKTQESMRSRSEALERLGRQMSELEGTEFKPPQYRKGWLEKTRAGASR